MSRPADRTRLTGDWEAPRVLYLQHATDPVWKSYCPNVDTIEQLL